MKPFQCLKKSHIKCMKQMNNKMKRQTTEKQVAIQRS